MDIFSLGAIAFHILSNQRPAANLYELDALLGRHKGLPLPAVVDAPSVNLQLLIRESTNPEVGLRVASATEFLDYLTEAEEELMTPTDSTIKNPLDAPTVSPADSSSRLDSVPVAQPLHSSSKTRRPSAASSSSWPLSRNTTPVSVTSLPP